MAEPREGAARTRDANRRQPDLALYGRRISRVQEHHHALVGWIRGLRRHEGECRFSARRGVPPAGRRLSSYRHKRSQRDRLQRKLVAWLEHDAHPVRTRTQRTLRRTATSLSGLAARAGIPHWEVDRFGVYRQDSYG